MAGSSGLLASIHSHCTPIFVFLEIELPYPKPEQHQEDPQRVALGRALLSKPRLLLLDEPLGSLDEGRKVEILPYLVRLRDEAGIPMVYVSHDAAELRQLATQIVMLKRGHITAFGGVKVLTAT